LIWLFNPATLGATKIYNGLLKPFVKKHEAKISAVIKEIEKMKSGLNDEKVEELKS
jgi:hypothetical protein